MPAPAARFFSVSLAELLECEQAICEACKNVKNFLAAAATFDGREIVVDLDEQVAA
jgi:hypothetical protein